MKHLLSAAFFLFSSLSSALQAQSTPILPTLMTPFDWPYLFGAELAANFGFMKSAFEAQQIYETDAELFIETQIIPLKRELTSLVAIRTPQQIDRVENILRSLESKDQIFFNKVQELLPDLDRNILERAKHRRALQRYHAMDEGSVGDYVQRFGKISAIISQLNLAPADIQKISSTLVEYESKIGPLLRDFTFQNLTIMKTVANALAREKLVPIPTRADGDHFEKIRAIYDEVTADPTLGKRMYDLAYKILNLENTYIKRIADELPLRKGRELLYWYLLKNRRDPVIHTILSHMSTVELMHTFILIDDQILPDDKKILDSLYLQWAAQSKPILVACLESNFGGHPELRNDLPLDISGKKLSADDAVAKIKGIASTHTESLLNAFRGRPEMSTKIIQNIPYQPNPFAISTSSKAPPAGLVQNSWDFPFPSADEISELLLEMQLSEQNLRDIENRRAEAYQKWTAVLEPNINTLKKSWKDSRRSINQLITILDLADRIDRELEEHMRSVVPREFVLSISSYFFERQNLRVNQFLDEKFFYYMKLQERPINYVQTLRTSGISDEAYNTAMAALLEKRNEILFAIRERINGRWLFRKRIENLWQDQQAAESRRQEAGPNASPVILKKINEEIAELQKQFGEASKEEDERSRRVFRFISQSFNRALENLHPRDRHRAKIQFGTNAFHEIEADPYSALPYFRRALSRLNEGSRVEEVLLKDALDSYFESFSRAVWKVVEKYGSPSNFSGEFYFDIVQRQEALMAALAGLSQTNASAMMNLWDILHESNLEIPYEVSNYWNRMAYTRQSSSFY